MLPVREVHVKAAVPAISINRVVLHLAAPAAKCLPVRPEPRCPPDTGSNFDLKTPGRGCARLASRLPETGRIVCLSGTGIRRPFRVRLCQPSHTAGSKETFIGDRLRRPLSPCPCLASDLTHPLQASHDVTWRVTPIPFTAERSPSTIELSSSLARSGCPSAPPQHLHAIGRDGCFQHHARRGPAFFRAGEVAYKQSPNTLLH